MRGTEQTHRVCRQTFGAWL